MKTIAIVMLTAVLFMLGCGVKGDPVPPENPPQLGRGRPNFKKATENIRVKPDVVTPPRTYRDDEAAEEQEESGEAEEVKVKKNNAIEESK